MRARSGARRGLLAAVVGLGVAVAVLAGLALQDADVPPRTLAARLDAIDAQRHPGVVGVRDWIASSLRQADRGEANPAPGAGLPPLAVGAQPQAPDARRVDPREVRVASIEAMRAAIDAARPGDVVTLAAGTYRLRGAALAARRPGTAAQPIVVRAERPGTAVVEVDAVEAIVVSAPYWTVENLTLRGVCAADDDCEHAFHVVAGAAHFTARNNTLVDFNAHVKVNGQDGLYPDAGALVGNTLTATRPRRTDRPVTDIDLVAASGWTVRGNLITDFVKAGGNRTAFGAFFKGGGTGNRFERNVVVCEHRLRGEAGVRVGLSLGGGGTDTASCRGGRCITEQDGGVVDANLVAACSDDGLYLNRAALSVVVHNTVVDTGGIVVRYPESSAVVEGNLVDGPIRSRDGGALHESDNLETGLPRLYLGQHPLRELFVDAAGLDFAWRAAVPRRAGVAASQAGAADLCGAPRAVAAAYGAFEDFARCRGKALP